jgi:hypothetical protein
VWKCLIARAKFERCDLRIEGGVRGSERCFWIRQRDSADDSLMTMMIGEIDDDCEAMVGAAAAGRWHPETVDWLGQERLQLVRPADSPQTRQSRVGQQQRCRQGIGHASSVNCFAACCF